jgi:hypothetical protein
MATKTADVMHGASAALAGALAPQLLGAEAVLWVLAALGMCSLGDVLAPATSDRWRLASRYVASVAVTLAASYSVGQAVARTWPQWADELWAVRIGAALVAALVLHPVIAMAPAALRQAWRLALRVVLDRFGGSAHSRGVDK